MRRGSNYPFEFSGPQNLRTVVSALLASSPQLELPLTPLILLSSGSLRSSTMQAVLPSRLPLISAPMAGCAGGQLSSEVVLAGGFAFIGAGHKDVQYLEEELKIARELLKQPTGRLCSIGVGFLTWRLEQLMSKEDAERMVEKACKETSAIWLAFGNDLQRWVELAQRCSNEVKVVILVTSVEQALEAAALGADVLVIQGGMLRSEKLTSTECTHRLGSWRSWLSSRSTPLQPFPSSRDSH